MTVSSETYWMTTLIMVFYWNLRFICVSNSKVLFLLQVEVGCNKVQEVLSHQLGLQGDRIIIEQGSI